MRTSKLSTLLLAALLAIAAAGCSPEDGPAPPAGCAAGQLGATCTVAADCCSNSCYVAAGSTSGTCVEPTGQCGEVGALCATPGDCCLGACPSGTCVDPAGGCNELGESCAYPDDCCSGSCEGALGAKVCTPGGGACGLLQAACTGTTPAEKAASCCSGYCNASNACDEPPVAGCLDANVTCSADSQCCSALCIAGRCDDDAGMCAFPGEACGSDAQCCSRNCPNAGTPGATCASAVCLQQDQSCASDSQCCSGVCGLGAKCAPLPPGPTGDTCKTLGDSCTLPTDCCSTNCQGGTCIAVAACSAPGDACYRTEDCCSGLCAAPANPGEPGRCDDAPGGCGQDGYPCSSDSGCCTKRCVDLGTGAKACQPSGGCRLNGNYCDGDASCCNVNHLVASSQWIHCDPADHVCDNGGSCNPPGDICGLNASASQNCCFGKKDVCKYDMNGIPRCFGGCPTNDCTQGPCPTGWDGNDPQCCIQPGDICQFRDQCCGLAPCVPGADGVLRCAEPPVQCLPSGATCSTTGSAPSPDPCCTGTTCTNINEIGWVCATDSTPPPNCILPDAACTAGGTACCVGSCIGGTCTSCLPNGNACTAGAQCCSTICDGGLCRPPCQVETGSCTVNADCCSGLTCEIPAGATSGTCTAGGGGGDPPCSATGQACALDTDCCTYVPGEGGDTCEAGTCTPPPTCSENLQPCTVGGGECCEGLSCVWLDAFEEEQPCQAGRTCYCNATCAPLTVPPAAPTPCSTLVPCCDGYCGDNTTRLTCSSTDLSSCSCQPIG